MSKVFNRYSAVLIVITTVIMLTVPLSAESILLKNGSIVEGKIIKETDRAITIKTSDGRNIVTLRADLLRVLYHDEFKEKKYIHTLHGKVIESYIVDETAKQYTYRTILNSSEEFVIDKKVVDFITKRKLEVVEKVEKKPGAEKSPAGSRESALKTSSPLVRIGYGRPDQLGVRFWDQVDMYQFNIYPFRFRDNNGSGFDLFGTFKYVSRSSTADDVEDLEYITGDDYEKLQELDETTLDYISAGAGVRYSAGFYFIGLLWQGYLSVHVQYAYVRLNVNGYDGTKSVEDWKKKNTTGAVSAVGVEIALTDYLGIFCEGTFGYHRAMSSDINIDFMSLIAGVSYRNSFL
jgi:hypothetical protein